MTLRNRSAPLKVKKHKKMGMGRGVWIDKSGTAGNVPRDQK